MRQFLSFVRKEFYHILRDRYAMIVLLAMPVILIILFGYAVTTEIKCAPIAVLDQSHDELTAKIVERLRVCEYFDLYTSVESYDQAQALFRQNKVRMVVVFPPNLASDRTAKIQILNDATDPNEATQLTAFCSAIITEQLKDYALASGVVSPNSKAMQQPKGITPVVSLLYNPQMKGVYYFVPGVMGLLLMLICAMMTSMGIVKEKEMGTMEVLLASPLKPIYIIIAKAVPYLLLSAVNIVTILLLAYFLLGVPINGSLLSLFFVSIIYAITSLSLGLLISTVTHRQRDALMLSSSVLMLPTCMLSGMIYPIENMANILQYCSNVVPATFYISIVKDIMIKGLSISDILKEVMILIFMTAVLLILSINRFKNKL